MTVIHWCLWARGSFSCVSLFDREPCEEQSCWSLSTRLLEGFLIIVSEGTKDDVLWIAVSPPWIRFPKLVALNPLFGDHNPKETFTQKGSQWGYNLKTRIKQLLASNLWRRTHALVPLCYVDETQFCLQATESKVVEQLTPENQTLALPACELYSCFEILAVLSVTAESAKLSLPNASSSCVIIPQRHPR